jgi:hypothetical protein
LEITASNSRSKSSACPSITRASSPRARAAATISGLASTPTTVAPVAATFSVKAPSPHPRSRMRSPGLVAIKAISGSPNSATKRALAA